MAKKASLKTISSGFASNTQLNFNFEALNDKLENTLSLDGSTPNSMGADLDLNGNGIVNVGPLGFQGGETLQDYVDNASASEANAAASQTAAEEAQAAAEAAKLAAEAAASINIYDSRALAIAANVPAAFNIIGVITGNDHILYYSRNSDSDALTTADGATWGPAFNASIEHFGDFTQANVTLMESEYDFVRVSSGATVGEDITISKRLVFDVGAYISVSTGFTVDVQADIESSNQHIFRGDGDVTLGGTGVVGEEARSVHVSWFGCFPNSDEAIDQAPFMQKCADAMGTTREGEIRFDVGNYYVQTKVTWSRANQVLGAGDRMTNINPRGSLLASGDVWDTSGIGVLFKGFQFTGGQIRTGGAAIRLLHDRCEVYDIYHDKFDEGVVLAGNECKAYRTKGLSQNTASGSASVTVSGNRCFVNHTDFTNFGSDMPECIVRVAAQANTIETLTIEATHGDMTTIGVLVEIGDGYYVKNLNIDGVNIERASDLVKVELAGSGYLQNFNISNLNASDGARAFNAALTGTGNLNRGNISNVSCESLTDTIIKVANTSTGVAEFLSISNITGDAIYNGISLAGTTAHRGIAISSVSLEGAGDGIDVKVEGMAVSAAVLNNTARGLVLQSGSDDINASGIYTGSGTAVVNGSGGSNVSTNF